MQPVVTPSLWEVEISFSAEMGDRNVPERKSSILWARDTANDCVPIDIPVRNATLERPTPF
jgi:hypothetical protein